MSAMVPPLRGDNLFGADGLVPAVARCWRAARDRGESTQQRLFALLSPQASGLLAPVFDSLLTLWEAALGRRMVVGAASSLSQDETLLVGLLEGSRGAEECGEAGAPGRTMLEHALRSTRIMIALAKR
jgi:hypothetical protein